MIEQLSNLSIETQTVLDRAQQIAGQSGKRFVGTGCLLLSIVEYSPESVGNPEKITKECRRLLRINKNGNETQPNKGLILPFSTDVAKILRAAGKSGDTPGLTVAQLLREVTRQGQIRTDATMILKSISLV